MKNRILLWIIAVILMTGCSSAKSSTEYYGVVVGCCSEFPNAPELDPLHAKDDAKSFYNILIDMYYGGNSNRAEGKVHLLTESKATQADIKNSLKDIATKAKAGDVVYFFFSGHGSSMDDKATQKIYEKQGLVKMMENSGIVLPYNFNLNQVGKTAIIGKRDLRKNGGYGFEYLDKKGVQIIMISDACYSGNIYRTTNNNTNKVVSSGKLNIDYDATIDMFKKNRDKKKRIYKNLIFFSAGSTQTAVAEDGNLNRGKFSLVIEKCIKKANQNGDNKITKKEFQECVESEDNAHAFVCDPPSADRLGSKTIFRAKRNHTATVEQKDKIRVKTSIQGLQNISNQIVIDNKNYDIEVIKSGNIYRIFRYTGEEYAKVDKSNLKRYFNSLKLFKLKGNSGKLKLKVTSSNTSKEMAIYCKGEEITATVEDTNSKLIVALTLDKNGGVIMLQPNDYQKFSSTLVRTVVQPPYGMDKIKVFALNSTKAFDQVKKLVVPRGLLNEYSVNELYKILKANKNFKEAEVDIETISTSIKTCKRGD